MASSERIDELRRKIARSKEMPKKHTTVQPLDPGPILKRLSARSDPDATTAKNPAGFMGMQPLLKAPLDWVIAEAIRSLIKLGSDEVFVFADYTGMVLASEMELPYRLVAPTQIPTHLDRTWTGRVPCPSVNVRRVMDNALECYTVGHHPSAEAYVMARHYIRDHATSLLVAGSKHSMRSIKHSDLIVINHLTSETKRIRHANQD